MNWQLLSGFVFWLFVAMLFIATALPLVRLPYGILRTLGFPRLQVIGGAAVLLLLAPVALNGWELALSFAILGATVVMQAVHVLPYSPFWKKQSIAAEAEELQEPFALLAANIKMSNRRYEHFVELIRREQPDVLLVMEADDGWARALHELAHEFPERIERPQDNTYGLIVYSKLPLEEQQVRCLHVDSVPSLKTIVRLPSGERFRLYVVHPEPPVPYAETKGRDAEIGLIGLEAGRDELPAIVAGDLNDVAWSYTTRRFQRLSGLLDPRIGRGLYNTFHASHRILRWPLDHLFHDPRFRLVEMRRLGDVGSDHFPMLFRLTLTAEPKAGWRRREARPDERQDVEEMSTSESGRSRKPIGTDWEK